MNIKVKSFILIKNEILHAWSSQMLTNHTFMAYVQNITPRGDISKYKMEEDHIANQFQKHGITHGPEFRFNNRESRSYLCNMSASDDKVNAFWIMTLQYLDA
jgi:hypothetical protein